MINKGEIVLDIKPGNDNPRNSEGAFINIEDKILFVYSRFKGNRYNDDSPCDLAKIYSTDDGNTWSKEEIFITSEDEGARNIMSVSLLRMQNNDIGLFYTKKIGSNDCRTYLKRSSDEGNTWGPAYPCIESNGYYVVNNDRIIRVNSGRIIIPAAYHRNGYDSYEKQKAIKFDSRGTVVFFVSDDDGKTWKEAKGKCTLPFNKYSYSGLQEPGILELNNGILWAWARTDIGHQYEMFSFDCGESWTSPQPSRFTSPCSPLSAKRIPNTNMILAIWNPIPNYNGRSALENKYWGNGRNPLVMSISKNEGNSWEEMIILDNEPEHGYCYTAIHFTDTAMLLAYCAGGLEDKDCLNKIRIRRIPIDNI